MKTLTLALLLPALAAAAQPAPQHLLDLHASGDLYKPSAYPIVREAVARDFAKAHADTLATAFGDDASELTAWLEQHRTLKEELFAALAPKADNVAAALGVFRNLWKANPDRVAAFPELAIAVAVTWDSPFNVYDHTEHQTRTASTMPATVKEVTAVATFQHMAEDAKKLRGSESFDRLAEMPYEFLVYVVDHRTPFEERRWAVEQYLDKRPLIGRTYGDIEYDTQMLRTRSRVCKLNGQPYTLPSIKDHGGVCAMQADFAARVGKSLVVPAAYVRGGENDQDRHAWVAWVEVTGIAKGKVTFEMPTFGRYFGQGYFTGTVRDPHTGETLLDDDWERRLTSAGNDRVAHRLADLILRLAPTLATDPRQKFALATKVIDLAPLREGAWLSLAWLVKSGELADADRAAARTRLASVPATLGRYPNLAWKVASELLALEADGPARGKVLEALIPKFEACRRPDLVCQARLKWADALTVEGRHKEAADGLANAIGQQSDQDQIVPEMIRRLRDAAGRFEGGGEVTTRCFLDVLERVPTRSGGEPSAYFLKLCDLALEHFDGQKDEKRSEQVRTMKERAQGR